jgi:cytochrome c5
MSNHDDDVFVRNFSMVLVGLAVIGITAFILAKIVNRSFQETQNASETVAVRIAPMGKVNTSEKAIAMAKSASATAHSDGGSTEAAPTASSPGEATYNKICFSCHAQGIAGAPKFGDMAAWEARLNNGRDSNIANAINGFTGSTGMMPARGGLPSLSDEEVTAAVDYMLQAVGGNGSATETSSEEAAPAVEEQAPQAAVEDAADAPAAADEVADNGRGKEVYDAACFVCHTPGAAGAPKLGDNEAWGPRVEKGIDTLYHSSLNGFMGTTGMMPPKGGRPDFSDDDVKAAVDYMVSEAE